MPRNQSTAARRARAASREGEKFTVALRDTKADAPTQTFPGGGRPWIPSWVPSSEHDVNAACGHHLSALCGGCTFCTTCVGCYCAEAAEQARIDAWAEAAYQEHDEHQEHRGDCRLCEHDRKSTDDYTRCPKCALPYPDGFSDHRWHAPPYCSPLPRYRLGTDWGYLRGQHVTLVGREYSVHGLVLADQEAPDSGVSHPIMQMRRTDAGYEDGPNETSPFNPRGWREVHPAPPATS